MSSQDFSALLRLWQSKLVESGFTDIEYLMSSGKVHPFFRENGSQRTLENCFNPDTQEYYRLAEHFLHDFNWSTAFGTEAELYKYLFYLHSEGVSFRRQVKLLNGHSLNLPKLRHVVPAPLELQQLRSIFWLHKRLHHILPHFKQYLNSRLESLD